MNNNAEIVNKYIDKLLNEIHEQTKRRILVETENEMIKIQLQSFEELKQQYSELEQENLILKSKKKTKTD